MRTLAEVKIGEKVVIKRLLGEGGLRRRLLDMGLTPGTVIHAEKKAPLGDPLEIGIRGYHLSLRRDECLLIEIEK